MSEATLLQSASPGRAEPQLGSLFFPLGFYSRGYLPHADHPGLLQMVTYRLADSLPREVVSRLFDELDSVAADRKALEKRRRLECWLDAGHGCCLLRQSEAARIVIDTWRRFARERYDLVAWVVMPNHVHVLIRAYEGEALWRIVQSWKSFTGKRIARLGEGVPPIWWREYWDRFIRDETHFLAAVRYIEHNPVAAGLVARPEDWPWSSAASRAEEEPSRGSARPGLAPTTKVSSTLGPPSPCSALPPEPGSTWIYSPP